MALRIADVSADAILLAGGARAILLQLANPAVGHAVAAHSNFAERPLDRLTGTLTYLCVIVFGTPEEARAVARRVGAAHRPVEGANDAALQLWVAATIYDTAINVRELVFGPLSDDDAESLLMDYAVVGTALGVPRELWPADRAAFATYWARAVGELRVDDVTRGVATALLHPVNLPWWMRPLMPTVRVVTAGLLDAPLRAAFGLEHDERRFARAVRIAQRVYPRLPRFVREAPQRHYLKRFRAGL